MRKVVVALALALFVLHQDFWNWSDTTLVFGFMPQGLFYHACYSLAAAALWLIAISFAWPKELVRWADSDDDGDAGGAAGAGREGGGE